jgi:hypothetical protein
MVRKSLEKGQSPKRLGKFSTDFLSMSHILQPWMDVWLWANENKDEGTSSGLDVWIGFHDMRR